MTVSSPSIVLFQHDLRLADNPALSAATDRGQPLICLYVWNPKATGFDMPGAASRWWLHYSLESFSGRLKAAGNDLTIRVGTPIDILSDFVREYPNSQVFWNQSCEPVGHESEQNILAFLKNEKVKGHGFPGNTLVDLSGILTQSRNPYRVFTPFWKRLQSMLPLSTPLPSLRKLPPQPDGEVKSEPLNSLNLLPRIDWAQRIRESWTPGEAGAQAALKKFLRTPAKYYAMDRDRPDLPHTSRMSPHLHFGEISPRQTLAFHSTRRNKNIAVLRIRKKL